MSPGALRAVKSDARCSSVVCKRANLLTARSSRERASDKPDFVSMEEKRKYLMSQDSGPTMASFLNWISEGVL